MKCKPPSARLIACKGCQKKHILTPSMHNGRCPKCGRPYNS